MNNKRAVFDLFVVSTFCLFVELVFIRWAVSEMLFYAILLLLLIVITVLFIPLGELAMRINRLGSQSRHAAKNNASTPKRGIAHLGDELDPDGIYLH